MKFRIYRTSRFPAGIKPGAYGFDDTATDDETNIEINSLDELLELCREVGDHIILHEDMRRVTGFPWLEIYDDYRE